MTRKLALGVAAPEAKWFMLGCCRVGHLAWGMKGSGRPHRDVQKQGETRHRPWLGWESRDLKFTYHGLPRGPLPSRVPRNWTAKDNTMETRGAWVQWMGLGGWIWGPFHPCHHSALFSCLLIPIQGSMENKCKEEGRKLETLGRT